MILITGGCGFIGSNIAAKLDYNGYKIAICDFLGLDDSGKISQSEKWQILFILKSFLIG
jgi:nucleoside-diphosphate-sugar epimerase